MIKAKKCEVTTKGSSAELRTDLHCIFRALNDEKAIDGADDVASIYKRACMDIEELQEMAADSLLELLDRLEELTK